MTCCYNISHHHQFVCTLPVDVDVAYWTPSSASLRPYFLANTRAPPLSGWLVGVHRQNFALRHPPSPIYIAQQCLPPTPNCTTSTLPTTPIHSKSLLLTNRTATPLLTYCTATLPQTYCNATLPPTHHAATPAAKVQLLHIAANKILSKTPLMTYFSATPITDNLPSSMATSLICHKNNGSAHPWQRLHLNSRVRPSNRRTQAMMPINQWWAWRPTHRQHAHYPIDQRQATKWLINCTHRVTMPHCSNRFCKKNEEWHQQQGALMAHEQ